jgi:hypothetical protein
MTPLAPGEPAQRSPSESVLPSALVPPPPSAASAVEPEQEAWSAPDESPSAVSSSGELALEPRAFLSDDNPATKDYGIAFYGRLELRHRHGPFEEKVHVFGRQDALDRGRSIVAVQEALLQLRAGPLRVRVGCDVLNWTATEAFHPADVINARNLDSDMANFEKIGEPLLSIQLTPFEGASLTVIAMPAYMKTLFPPASSRLNFTPGLNLQGERALVDRKGKFTEDDFGPQGAVVLQQTLGSADVSLHLLEHMDKLQPWLGVDTMRAVVLPVFETVRQVGGTYQQVIGSLIIKLEAAYRWFLAPKTQQRYVALRDPSDPSLRGDFPKQDHGIVALGLEYGLSHGSSGDSTLLVEAQAVLRDDELMRRALSPFQRDVLVGYRFSWNDTDSREAYFGGVFDLEHAGEALIDLSYRQRIGETWSARIAARFFTVRRSAFATGLTPLRDASHVQLVLTRHF